MPIETMVVESETSEELAMDLLLRSTTSNACGLTFNIRISSKKDRDAGCRNPLVLLSGKLMTVQAKQLRLQALIEHGYNHFIRYLAHLQLLLAYSLYQTVAHVTVASVSYRVTKKIGRTL